MFQNVTKCLFPGRCPGCDAVLGMQHEICDQCMEKWTAIKEPICKKCGKPVEGEKIEYCFDCEKGKHVFTQGRALYVYQGAVKESLYRFKYQGRQEYASFYAKKTWEMHREWFFQKQIEAIVPIPLHKKRRRKRGYNQAECYARELGRLLDIPVRSDLLCRKKETSFQKELNDVQRRNNLKNAFKCTENIVQFKCVLLVDDIYTTGSTIDAAAEELLQHGAHNIYFFCVGIGRGF